MARRSKTYTPEFKAEAVRLARSSDETIPQIAHDLGLSVWTLRGWLKAPRTGRPAPPAGPPADAQAELTQLRREVRQLRMERDILKKATAFFAKQSE
jgi:transposase